MNGEANWPEWKRHAMQAFSDELDKAGRAAAAEAIKRVETKLRKSKSAVMSRKISRLVENIELRRAEYGPKVPPAESTEPTQGTRT